MGKENCFLCSICFQPIILENCKIDEDGRPVHERCYAQMLLLASASKKTPIKNPPFLGKWRRAG